jgi:hypothetical protein
MKRYLVASVAGAALALTLTFGSAAAAPAAAGQPAPAAQTGQPGAPKARGPHGARGGAGSLISAAASVTGLAVQQIRTELAAGKSLAQIAQEHGKTANDVIAAARTAYQSALSQSVASKRLTQAQADAALARFDQRAAQIVNDTTIGQRAGGACANRAAKPTQ